MLTASVRSQASGSRSSQRPVGPAIPALLTSTSSPPSEPTASANSRATEGRSTTSHTLRPSVASVVLRPSRAASSTSQTCTRAPSSAKARAVARPIPLTPAVTSTRAPSSAKARAVARPIPLAPAVTSTRAPSKPNDIGKLIGTSSDLLSFPARRRRMDSAQRVHYNYQREPNAGPKQASTFPEEFMTINRIRRGLLQGGAAATTLGALGFPSISRGQTDAIRLGHLTPRTGFLGPLGEYAVMGVNLAVDEINAAGGVMGRKIELIAEDSVNPQTASTKAQRLIERDKVVAIIGEISSASGLAIAQVAQRNKTIFFNTGCNSDELRGKSCNRYMFHTEAANSMYVNEAGRALLRDGMVKGKKWYSLTADYAFGHDLLRVAKRFMQANGGEFAADELVPTDATDFSAYLLKIRNAKPDLVVSNLAGAQITNF